MPERSFFEVSSQTLFQVTPLPLYPYTYQATCSIKNFLFAQILNSKIKKSNFSIKTYRYRAIAGIMLYCPAMFGHLNSAPVKTGRAVQIQ